MRTAFLYSVGESGVAPADQETSLPLRNTLAHLTSALQRKHGASGCQEAEEAQGTE